MLDYLIIGAGISGVAFARLLQLSGVTNFIILEATACPGGLCRSIELGNHILDIGGGHFLCTKFDHVYEFIFAHIPRSEFNRFNRVSKVHVDGHFIDYPLESNLWQLSPDLSADYLRSVEMNGESRGRPAPSNFEDWVRWKLGDKIADRYMLPYNRKLWGVPVHDMDIDWLYKIPRLNIDEITRACAERRANAAFMPSHAVFFYPKRGGFQRIFDALCLPVRDHIECGVPAAWIEKLPSGLLVNGKYEARKVINTGGWHAIADSPVFQAPVRNAIGKLRSNGIVVSLHEETYESGAHWIYEPDEAIPHHRTFYIRNFAPHSHAKGICRETNDRRWAYRPDALFWHRNKAAYPIPTLGWARAIKEVLVAAERLGIYGLGRWGQWQYFNSDVCINEAIELSKRLGHTGWPRDPEERVLSCLATHFESS